MNIHFSFDGCQGRRRDFKSEAAYELFEEYVQRIGHFTECSVAALGTARKPGSKLWLCDPSVKAKAFSSEALARELEKMRDGGVRALHIGIGGAEGFDKKKIDALAPDLLWSLGPMTLPHELASIVAAEQVYRAFTILKGIPYHK